MLFLLLLATLGCFAPVGQCQNAQSLGGVKKVYVDAFSGGKAADQLRANLIKRLKRDNYQVADSPADADAVVKGDGQVWIKGYLTTNWRAPTTNRQPVYGGYLSVEVVGKDGKALWSYLVTPGKLVWTSITDDLTGTLMKQWIAAAREPNPAASASQPNPNLTQTVLHGAGATFPAPLYRKWFQTFEQRNPQVRITYDAVGSEEGAQRLAAGEVDFAASDVSSPDLGNPHLPTNFRRIATVLGAVVPIYNVSGLTEDLRFTPEVLAGIYLGRIRKWNDPEIRKWNRGADLPDQEIVVVHRADGSGTTYTLTDFLTKTSPEWKTAVGMGTHVNWPVGVGKEGNDGVASEVQSTPNAIGYVELVYAIQHQLSFGTVRNSSGEFIRAGLDTLAEAARSATSDNSELPASITNAAGKGAYPVATFTWILLPADIKDRAKEAALVEVLKWMVTDGQRECSALAYAPLPRELADRELQLINSFK